jgi:hypothetical protein
MVMGAGRIFVEVSGRIEARQGIILGKSGPPNRAKTRKKAGIWPHQSPAMAAIRHLPLVSDSAWGYFG